MNAERRPGEEAAHESAGGHDTDRITRSPDIERALRVYVVIALTPSGDERRRVYLSSTRADDRARTWAARGWTVLRISAIASPTRIEQVSA